MPHFETRCRCIIALPLGLVIFALGSAKGASSGTPGIDIQQSAYSSSMAQESVRKQADKIQADLVRLVAEMKQNGLAGDDLATISQASMHLSGLSQEEMAKVIDALQSASMTAEESKRNQSLVNAYQGQMDLVLKLKQLATTLSVQPTGEGLVNQLENLIARQSANIHQTALHKASEPTSDFYDAREKLLHDVTTAEQSSIGAEIDDLFKGLTVTAGQPSSDDDSASAQTALDAMNATTIKATASEATQLTNGGPFSDAVTRQTTVRQDLIAVLKAAVAKADAVTRLDQAKTLLDQVMADQKDLTDLTKQSKVDEAALAERQAEIKDAADLTKSMLQPLNQDAANKVDAAQQDMKQSANDLADAKNPADITPEQEETNQALAEADKLLDQQIASVQNQASESASDQLAQVQKAQDEIKQAQAAEQNNPQEAANELQKAQQDALADSPDAAEKLGDAADQLQQSEPNADAANQDLAQANQELQNQKDALAQSAQESQALAQANAHLDQASQLATAAEQQLKNGANTDLAGPARDLAAAQAQVEQASPNLPKNSPNDAQASFEKAADALKAGSIAAVQANRDGAEGQTQQGLAALQEAQRALAQAMAQIQSPSHSREGKARGQQSLAQTKDSQNHSPNAGTNPGTQHAIPGWAADELASSLVMGGLSPKDRDAITQYQAEKTPPEYAPLVQQYLKNLAAVPETH